MHDSNFLVIYKVAFIIDYTYMKLFYFEDLIKLFYLGVKSHNVSRDWNFTAKMYEKSKVRMAKCQKEKGQIILSVTFP